MGFYPNLIESQHLIRQKSLNKVVKIKNIVKEDTNEDLLAHWDKKYGGAKKIKKYDEWGNEITSDPTPPQPKKEIPNPEPKKKGYVENVLANQPVANGEEFEDNWDDEEGSPIHSNVDSTKYQRHVNKENTKFRHPDIPDELNKRTKKKKKNKKRSKKPQQSDHPISSGNAEDFELDWDG